MNFKIFNARATQRKAAAFAGLLATQAVSSAATLGGLTKAQSAASDIQAGLFALVGVIAIIYLIYLGVMAFTEKKSWSDFGWGAVHVSVVGGAVALAGWAWTLFA